jgi:hypothetical protein
LRTSGVQIMGGGEISPQSVPQAVKQSWEWVKEGKLTMEVEQVPLRDIAEAWERKTDGKRIVIVP